MAAITSKGRRGKRNTLPDAQVNGQAEGDNAVSDGNGQVSQPGDGLPKVQDAKSEGNTFGRLVGALHAEEGLISRAWFPQPELNEVTTNKSVVPIYVGAPSYQLSTGEIITL